MAANVLIVQRRMTHYRVPFFECLRKQMDQNGLKLRLAFGTGTADEESKDDAGDLPWATRLSTKYLANGKICYQPLGNTVNGADLVVLTLENKLICNLWHQIASTPYKVALWGHGANLQGNSRTWREQFKRRVARRADWWFGYTELSRPILASAAFPPERVTIVNNTIDTNAMLELVGQVDDVDVRNWCRQHGLRGGTVGLFVGSLYAEKRIRFMLEAAQRIHERQPAFELAIVGSGPDRALVESFCNTHAWAKYLGILKGAQKATALAAAQVMLNPGLVGLGILDSFVGAAPMVTTDCGIHSPEIVYLQHGQNGLMTPNTLEAYVDSVVGILADIPARRILQDGCRQSASLYTIDNMAARFLAGIKACLHAPRFR